MTDNMVLQPYPVDLVTALTKGYSANRWEGSGLWFCIMMKELVTTMWCPSNDRAVIPYIIVVLHSSLRNKGSMFHWFNVVMASFEAYVSKKHDCAHLNNFKSILCTIYSACISFVSAAFETIYLVLPLTRISATIGSLIFLLLFFQCLRSSFTKKFIAFTVSDVTSAPQITEWGVPRGSVLGLLFFVLHIHPLSQIVFNSGFTVSENTQVYNPALPVDFNLISKQTERCVHRVRICMKTNKTIK